MTLTRALQLTLLSLCTLTVISPVSAQTMQKTFKETHKYELKADGPDTGKTSYQLIRKVLGKKPIESPDLYRSNHPKVSHILEGVDDVVGPHFIFLSHLDEDKDRDKDYTDRQRNEIKAYDNSKPGLKGYKNETMQYRWKFKIDDGFEFSKNFTHFFQIKAKNFNEGPASKDSAKFPVITFTAVDRGEKGNEFQLRHTPSLTPEGKRLKAEKLIRKDMALFTDQWVEFFVQINYQDQGQLIVRATNIETGEVLIDFKKDGIDMWRGETRQDFSRPKWGIYRSIKQKESLRSDEERAYFADFSIRKGVLKDIVK